jgi:hypothetical protein
MVAARKRPTDWRRRYAEAKPARTVMLHTDFAGIKSGTTLFIGSPGVLATFIARIPPGEKRTIARLRDELARQNVAEATCTVNDRHFPPLRHRGWRRRGCGGAGSHPAKQASRGPRRICLGSTEGGASKSKLLTSLTAGKCASFKAMSMRR